uniref:Uncharacterized protein n=1 Tax=Panagrolaimus sp. PS1159 TaxID=55785 RepID=A0AC35GQ61_9BILA
MDFVNRIASLSVIFAAFVLFIICQTSAARSISYYQSENPFELSDSYLSFQQQQSQEQEQYQPQELQQQQTSESTESSVHPLEKRRLVVRVPFAQSPDSIQLHRLYKTLFDNNNNTKQKKFMSLQALL